MHVHLTISKLDIGKASAPRRTWYRKIDIAFSEYSNDSAADKIHRRLCLDKIQPHHTVDALDDEVASAAVDLKIGIRGHLDNIIDPVGKRSRVFRQTLAEFLDVF